MLKKLHMTASAPLDLQRFIKAQDPVFEQVRTELRQGQKQSHWMWFIFPQLKGLGNSPTAVEFQISSLQEAMAYSDHPILGSRLRECTQLVNLVRGHSISDIFGYPDDLKFRSSMTLFACATSANAVFSEALEKYFSKEPDPLTIALLARTRASVSL
jgi:uncharacterized protein (DUF1810 family)